MIPPDDEVTKSERIVVSAGRIIKETMVRGVLVEKLFCSFVNPLISLCIYYDQYEKIWRKKSK